MELRRPSMEKVPLGPNRLGIMFYLLSRLVLDFDCNKANAISNSL